MASRSSDLSGVGGVGIGCGIVLAILSTRMELLDWNEFLRSSMAVRSRSRIDVSVGMDVGASVGRSAADEELSVIAVGVEVLLSLLDLRCVAVEVSSAFLCICFAGMQQGCEDVWKNFPWES